MRSSASPRSWMVKFSSNPICAAYSRSSRAPMPWKVPAHGSAGGRSDFRPSTRASTWPARRSISCAARREKVSSSRRCGSTPSAIRCATRCASVLVLPEPAPAITSSGRWSAPTAAPTPCSTAARWSSLSAASAAARRSACVFGGVERTGDAGVCMGTTLLYVRPVRVPCRPVAGDIIAPRCNRRLPLETAPSRQLSTPWRRCA
ncbi:hypothetical protein D3C72_860230 [compost metagenome]